MCIENNIKGLFTNLDDVRICILPLLCLSWCDRHCLFIICNFMNTLLDIFLVIPGVGKLKIEKGGVIYPGLSCK